MDSSRTIVGDIEEEVLEFTSGADLVTDLAIADVDCIGTAAHVATLASLPDEYSILSQEERDRVTGELVNIMRKARRQELKISLEDQDVHMLVERLLTRSLGDTGRRVHTGRSRNDQVAVDLRLLARRDLPELMLHVCDFADGLLAIASENSRVPMMGRTHSQPAMLSSVALWATAHVESLIDDLKMIRDACNLTDRCPLGSAAGYGVPLPLDRRLTAELLGFERPHANVLYASNARGKYELIILSALSQLMMTFSRFAEDLIMFSMPEFGYFGLPEGWCTGSSIMPQKKNPDVLEIIRARAGIVESNASAVAGILTGLQSGYSRDLQETKRPFVEGLNIAGGASRVLAGVVNRIQVNRDRLAASIRPEVFATDEALKLVADGVPFREAYKKVREQLKDVGERDPVAALDEREKAGWSGSIDFETLNRDLSEARMYAREKRSKFNKTVSTLLGVKYPGGFDEEG
jgi:argininosuccinate lyase